MGLKSGPRGGSGINQDTKPGPGHIRQRAYGNMARPEVERHYGANESLPASMTYGGAKLRDNVMNVSVLRGPMIHIMDNAGDSR